MDLWPVDAVVQWLNAQQLHRYAGACCFYENCWDNRTTVPVLFATTEEVYIFLLTGGFRRQAIDGHALLQLSRPQVRLPRPRILSGGIYTAFHHFLENLLLAVNLLCCHCCVQLRALVNNSRDRARLSKAITALKQADASSPMAASNSPFRPVGRPSRVFLFPDVPPMPTVREEMSFRLKNL